MKIGVVYIVCSYLSLIISCSNSDEKKCSKLKRGEFYYKSKISFAGSTIKRTDSIQVVTDEETGKKQKEKIEWINPCVYMLYPFPDNDSLNPDLFPVKVEILDVTGKYYTVHVSSQQYKADFYDTVWVK